MPPMPCLESMRDCSPSRARECDTALDRDHLRQPRRTPSRRKGTAGGCELELRAGAALRRRSNSGHSCAEGKPSGLLWPVVTSTERRTTENNKGEPRRHGEHGGCTEQDKSEPRKHGTHGSSTERNSQIAQTLFSQQHTRTESAGVLLNKKIWSSSVQPPCSPC